MRHTFNHVNDVKAMDAKIFELANLLVCAVSSDGYLLRVSEGLRIHFGENLVGRHVSEVIHAEDFALLIPEVTAGIRSQKGFTNRRARCLRADGSWMQVAWSGGASKGDQIICVGMEIADSPSVGEDQQRWFENILDYLPIPLMFLEPGTARMLFANRKALELSQGKLADKSTPEDYFAIYKVTDARGEPVALDQLPAVRAARGEVVHDQELVWHTDAGPIWFLARTVSIPALYGKPATILFLNQDITSLKAVEQDLIRLIRARDEFLSIASHELKTPLTSLQLQAEIRLRELKKRPSQVMDPRRFEEDLSNDLRQIKRVARLIDDMLDVSRIRSGKLALRRTCFDLGELAREVAARFAPQATLEGVRIDVHIDGPISGYWDRFRLEQVCLNLLTNALRYGEKKPVRLEVKAAHESAFIHVKDLGIGIDPKDHARVFDPFERAVSANEISGLGLGLHIAREIVRAHGGSIHLRSQPREGSEFIVQLPIAKNEEIKSDEPVHSHH